jgi:hypothetical protein
MTRRPQLTTILLTAAFCAAAATQPSPRLAAQTQTPANPQLAPVTAALDLSTAVCPVVYQLDDSPGARGYHYIFYGNAFFINRDGYLLTAAHVLSEFHNGGQPSILLRLPSAPPRLLKVSVVATDIDHDVAILRAVPNPFSGPYKVATLALATEKPSIGQPVLAAALRPAHLKDPESFELPAFETYAATILDYHSMQLTPNNQQPATPLLSTPAKAKPVYASDQEIPPGPPAPENRAAQVSPSLANSRDPATDLFLFSHEVQRGQSGAPVTDAQTHQVVGLIEGRWLHPALVAPANPAKGSVASALAPTQGAAIPIPYALALLNQNHISYGTVTAP